MHLLGCAAAAASSADRSPLFEGFNRLGVPLGMNWPVFCRENPSWRTTLDMDCGHMCLPNRFDEAAPIWQRSAGGLALLWIGRAQDAGDKGRFLTFTQRRPTMSLRMIIKPSQPFGVEALDGIAHELALDPDHSRRIGPAHTLQGIGNRPHP